MIETKEHKVYKSHFLLEYAPTEKNFMLPMPDANIALNQYTFGTCTCYSLAMAAMLAVYGKTRKWVVLSPESLRGRIPGNDGGATLWYYVEALSRFGILPRADFSHIGDNPKIAEKLSDYIENTPYAEKIAKRVMCKRWGELRNFDEAKKAIYSGFPVVGVIRSNGKEGKHAGGIEPIYPANPTGYHAVCFVGWKQINGKEYMVAMNSYGSRNGDRGLIYIPRGRAVRELIALDINTDIKPKCKNICFRVGSRIYHADGVEKEFEAHPYIKNGRTYLPVRLVAENLGADVEWNESESVATLESEEAVIEVRENSNILNINGKDIPMDVPVENVKGRLMCPIRHIAEAFGCAVSWDAQRQLVTITTKERNYV